MDRKKKPIVLLIAGALFLSACSPETSSSVSEVPASSLSVSASVSSVNGGEEKEISFVLPTQYRSNAATKLRYSDSYFSDSSLTYSPRIATASLLLSSRSSTALSKQSSGIKHVLNRLGFTDFEAFGFDKDPAQDSIAYIFAKKELSSGETLVYLGIRSSDYGSEWGGNFEVGNEGKEHLGFNKAASAVFSSLQEYLKNNVAGKAVLWGTGYSRGASVLNLIGARTDEWIEESPDSVLSKEKCFFYCLEPARTVAFSSSDEKSAFKGDGYANIFNVVNDSDIVPSVPMANLSFTRYGIDHVLNDPYSPYYSQIQKEALDRFNSLFGTSLDAFPYSSFAYKGKETVGSSSYDVREVRIHPRQGRYVNRLADALGEGIGSREEYVSSLENLLVPFMAFIESKDSPFSTNTLSDAADSYFTDERKGDLISSFISGNEENLTSVLVPFFEELNTEISYETEEDILQKGVSYFVKVLLHVKEADPDGLGTLLGVSFFTEEELNGVFANAVLMNVVKLAYSHSFEMNYAYLLSENPDVSSSLSPYSEGYYTLSTEATLSGNFYDGKTLVASFKNGLPVSTDSSSYYGVENGKDVVVLPKGGEYSFDGNRPETFTLTYADCAADSLASVSWTDVFTK